MNDGPYLVILLMYGSHDMRHTGFRKLTVVNGTPGFWGVTTDKTLAHPEGILEDVLIKVGKFVFPVDFVVINMEEDKQVPLLLGRPFLATKAALIDVKKGDLTIRVGVEAVHFNLNHSLKQPELSSADYEIVETKIPVSSELAATCNF